LKTWLFGTLAILAVLAGLLGNTNAAKADTSSFGPALMTTCGAGWTNLGSGNFSVPTNGGTTCHTAIWDLHSASDHPSANCTVNTFIPANATAQLTYGVFNSNNIRIATFSINQATVQNRNIQFGPYTQFHHIQVADSTGTTGQTLGVGNMFFTGSACFVH
jgi:hypothetical protein